MSLRDDIEKEIAGIFSAKWTRTDGSKVPDAEKLALRNDALILDGTVLYADLADSTGLVDSFKDEFAAEVYKSYLLTACRILKKNGGEITAFDGDRVMAVFVGDNKNSSAARTALEINYAVHELINPQLKKVYKSTTYQVQQAIGIDSGKILVAKTGIRGSNDLVWVGRSANYAAKLCGMRDGHYTSFITERVFKCLSDGAKYGGNPKKVMWEKIIWPEMKIPVYGSTWRWSI